MQVSDTAISLFPNMPIPYLFNSLAAYQLKMNKKSIEVAEKGLVYVIDNPSIKAEFMTFIAESYYRENKYEKSDSVFDEILVINPDNIYILNNYAYYLSLRGEKLVKAQDLGERLVKLAPNNPSYLDTYGWVLFVSEDYTEAEKYVRQAYDLGGKDRFTIVEHYGDIMYKLGNEDDALKYWKEAAKLNKPSEILQNKIATGKM
jgi:tetratricopeptide (TPR) repeat protein